MAGPIPQDEAFHAFADVRALFGIPNFWNVLSNLPFAVVGIAGLSRFRGFADRVLFAGILLTAFGSTYYHLAPNDARLVWDRLPMTIVFMAFTAAVVDLSPAELFGLLVAGGASVLWWHYTDDLRPYAVIKFGPILLIAPLLIRSKHRGYLWAVVGLFGIAEGFEMADRAMGLRGYLSGHTLKHLIAGCATWAIYCWRRTSTQSEGSVLLESPEVAVG